MTRRATPAASRKIDTIVLGGLKLCLAAWDAS
jgi:hypothetical protein